MMKYSRYFTSLDGIGEKGLDKGVMQTTHAIDSIFASLPLLLLPREEKKLQFCLQRLKGVGGENESSTDE